MNKVRSIISLTTMIFVMVLTVKVMMIGLDREDFLPSGAGMANDAVPAFISEQPSSEVGVDSSAPAFTRNDCLDAIEWVESKGDPNAIGDLRNGVYRAIGSFQLWKIYVDEVNRICGILHLTEQFTYEDRCDKTRSRKMSLIHNEYWADIAMLVTEMDYAEAFVRSHQGACGYRTDCTKPFWKKVKARMESVQELMVWEVK